MSNYNAPIRWYLIDGCGYVIGGWADRPNADQVRLAILSATDNTMGPFVLVEGFRREVWEMDYSAREPYRLTTALIPDTPAGPVQSGPRKVVIR